MNIKMIEHHHRQRLATYFSSLTLVAGLLLASSHLEQVSSQAQEVDKEGVPIPCIDNGKFYRNPVAANTRQDCGKYYQCYDNKVISFRCNSDLYFDVDRQICDFKLKVSNCDKSHGKFHLCVSLNYLYAIYASINRLICKSFNHSWQR